MGKNARNLNAMLLVQFKEHFTHLSDSKLNKSGYRQ